MSGPTTAQYDILGDVLAGATGLAAVILAARAIKEAHAMRAEYGEAHKQVCERESNRVQQRKQLRDAKTTHLSQLYSKAERLKSKLARLQALLLNQTGASISAPIEVDPSALQDEHAWNIYLGKLGEAIHALETQLHVDGGQTQLMTTLLAEQPNTNRLLTAYAQQFALQSKLPFEEQLHYKELSQHLLSRLELAAEEGLPVRIESLVCGILQANDIQRAEALAADLRLEIQRVNQHRKQQVSDSEEAGTLLTQLADALPEELRSELEHISAGVSLMEAHTRSLANLLLDQVKASRNREVQEAVSVVLEQSLRDLGYEVNDIDQTLFVSGGLIHFQKQAWQNYHVRMRVNTTDKSINFNVVRAEGSGDVLQDKRRDHLAEDRWCSEFPTLLKTLEARGVKLNVTRLLQAGEVPVQIVDAATLPVTRSEEQIHRSAELKKMMLG